MPDPRLVLALAARAQCDVRTARGFLGGRRPRGHLLVARLDDAARDLAIPPPTVGDDADSTPPPRMAG